MVRALTEGRLQAYPQGIALTVGRKVVPPPAPP